MGDNFLGPTAALNDLNPSSAAAAAACFIARYLSHMPFVSLITPQQCQFDHKEHKYLLLSLRGQGLVKDSFSCRPSPVVGMANHSVIQRPLYYLSQSRKICCKRSNSWECLLIPVPTNIRGLVGGLDRKSQWLLESLNRRQGQRRKRNSTIIDMAPELNNFFL